MKSSSSSYHDENGAHVQVYAFDGNPSWLGLLVAWEDQGVRWQKWVRVYFDGTIVDEAPHRTHEMEVDA